MVTAWTPGNRVLLVGGKPDGSLAALAALGARVTCVALPKHARALDGEIEHAVAVRDPANVEDVLLGLGRHGIDLSGFHAVTSGLEFGLTAAAVLGALAGARALPVEVAARLRDKHLQKTVVRAAGIRTARSAVFSGADAVKTAVDEVGGLPVVVKPPDGAGGRATAVLRTAEELAAWPAHGDPGPWLCEEFVPGTEIHVDGAIRDGRVTSTCVSRYFANLLTARYGALNGSVTLPEAAEPALYAAAHDLTTRVAAALGHTDGVYHLEAFVQPDGSLVFSECAGRVGGGRIDGAVRLSTGTDLHAAWAASALGAPEPPAAPGTVAACAQLQIHAPVGRLLSMPTLAEVAARPGVVAAELKLKPGAVTASYDDTNVRAGRALIAAPTPEEAVALAYDVNAWFQAEARTEEV